MIVISPDAKLVGYIMLAIGPVPLLWVLFRHAMEWLQSRKERQRGPSLPLTITEIRRPHYSRNSGLGTDVSFSRGDKSTTINIDTPLLGTNDVFISNTSLTNSVTLKFDLLLTDETGRETRLPGDGRDKWGKLLGKHDAASISYIARALDFPGHILSPVTIKPQTTVRGYFAFLLNDIDVPSAGLSEEEQDEFLGKWNREIWWYFVERAVENPGGPTFKYALEITDLISATVIKIQLPTKGYKGL